MILSEIRGVKKVVTNLHKKHQAHDAAIERGLKKGGLFLQRESQKIVPVDTGNLRRSAFTRAEGKGFKCKVQVGYTAAYGLFVHENLDVAHGAAYNVKHAKEIAAGTLKSRGPNQQAKYLETPARANVERISEILRKEVIEA